MLLMLVLGLLILMLRMSLLLIWIKNRLTVLLVLLAFRRWLALQLKTTLWVLLKRNVVCGVERRLCVRGGDRPNCGVLLDAVWVMRMQLLIRP